MTREITVTFTPALANGVVDNTRPGSWNIQPDPAPDFDYPDNNDELTRKYQYNLTNSDWHFEAVSIRLLESDSMKGDNPFITVTKARAAQTPSASYENFDIKVAALSDTMLLLTIENKNQSTRDVVLGLALTVGNGTVVRTSHDPQIKLKKRQQ
jgi:hypothetical protein